MPIFVDCTEEFDENDYAPKELPKCPVCGAKPYISRDIVDGFYFGWSVGCPRFCHEDGIHGTTYDTPEDRWYSKHCLNSKEECIKWWLGRVEREGKNE